MKQRVRDIIKGEGEYDSLPDLIFDCPGCEGSHGVITRVVDESRLRPRDLKWYKEHNRPHWTFDGNYRNPTFSPSINLKIEYTEEGKPNHDCHSFIKDGEIQYLTDCTHKFAGQTIVLPYC